MNKFAYKLRAGDSTNGQLRSHYKYEYYKNVL